MNNDITITLTGVKAYDFMRNQSLDESTISLLQDLVETKDEEITKLVDQLSEQISLGAKLQQDYDILDSKYQAIISQQDLSYRIARDTDLANSIAKPTFTEKDRTEAPNDLTIYKEPSKLKTRLSKQDKQELDTMAYKNFTSDHRVDKFAKSRNLRPSTVITYIKKHSNNAYTLVKGSDIKQGDMGYKFSVAKNAIYFTFSDDRYPSL